MCHYFYMTHIFDIITIYSAFSKKCW